MIIKHIKEVLLCKPLYFSVEYAINPWMQPGTVDKNQAMQQWKALVNTLTTLKISVKLIDQVAGLPDMVFSTDQAITVGNKVLLSNFRYPERRSESKFYKKWFEENDYSVNTLPNDLYLEGSGDCLFWGDIIFMGYGFRSTIASAKTTASLLNIDVIPLELINPKYYHLDLAFLPINSTSAIYYPKAFSQNSQKKKKKNIPDLYEFTEKEVSGFAANSLVTGNHVILQKNNPTFVNRIRKLGYYPIEIDISEFLKAGGGIHCLVQILKEKYE